MCIRLQLDFELDLSIDGPRPSCPRINRPQVSQNLDRMHADVSVIGDFLDVNEAVLVQVDDLVDVRILSMVKFEAKLPAVVERLICRLSIFIKRQLVILIDEVFDDFVQRR